jgi:hypothetical protein
MKGIQKGLENQVAALHELLQSHTRYCSLPLDVELHLTLQDSVPNVLRR